MKPAVFGLVLLLAALTARAEIEAARVETAPAGAVLRGLDRVAGETVDFVMHPGDVHDFGRLRIELTACRYPTDAPLSDAFAALTIFDNLRAEQVFSGWMMASSPALSALDHPRYDVWVLRCNTAFGEEVSAELTDDDAAASPDADASAAPIGPITSAPRPRLRPGD